MFIKQIGEQDIIEPVHELVHNPRRKTVELMLLCLNCDTHYTVEQYAFHNQHDVHRGVIQDVRLHSVS